MGADNGNLVSLHQEGNEQRSREESEEERERKYLAEVNKVVRPLDGGYAWLIMISGFFCSLVVDGITYSFGMLLEDFAEAFQCSTATVSIAGSLVAALYMVEGPVLSPLIERFGYRKISMVGGVVALIAFFLAHLSDSIGFFIVAYGVLGGISLGLIYLPSMIIVCQYFQKYRPIATGVCAAGSGVGMLVFAPLTKALYAWYGWRGTLIILSALCIQTMPFCALYRELRTFYIPDIRRLKREYLSGEARSFLLPVNCESELLLRNGNGNGNGIAVTTVVPVAASNGGDSHCSSVDLHNANDEKDCYRSRTSLGHQRKPRTDAKDAAPAPRHAGSYDALHAAKRHRTRSGGENKGVAGPFQRTDIFYTGDIKQLDPYKKALAVSREMVHKECTDSPRNRQAEEAEVEKMADNLYIENVTKSTKVTEPSEASHISGMQRFFKFTLPQLMNSMFAFELLKEPSFLVILTGNFFAFTGILIIMMYVPNHARSSGADSQQQALLIVVLGAFNTVGRIFFNFLAQRMSRPKRLMLHNGTSIIAGVVTLFVPLCVEYWMMIVYVAVFGLFLAPIISLTTPLLSDLFGIENLTQTFGLMCLVRGLACFIGPPLGGIIKDATGSYSATFITGGSVYIIAGLICCLLHLPSIKRVRFLQKDEEADDEQEETSA